MAANYDDIDNGMKQYFKSLKKFEPLSKEEEHRLLEAYKKHNDLNARNKLIESNLKYACKLANEYRGNNMTFSELVSEANDGLMYAIDKFDLSQDIKLISYSRWWIMQRMQAALSNKINLTEIPDENNFNSESINNQLCIEDYDNTYENNNIMLENAMLILNEREYDIISKYYGLNNNKQLTLDEIGKIYNLSKERIRQIIEKTLTKLRSEVMLCDSFYN